MADDDIPENVDLRFLATQNARVLRELGDLRERMIALEIGQGALSADLKIIKADVSEIAAVQRNQGARLNAIDGRLALIERHTGMVEA